MEESEYKEVPPRLLSHTKNVSTPLFPLLSYSATLRARHTYVEGKPKITWMEYSITLIP